MSGLLSLNGQIKNPRSKIFRRLLIKRRQQGTGTYESDWQDISADVIKWGSIKKEVDSTRPNQFKFSNITLTLNNEEGLYSPASSENSLWYGYGDQQRTLVKIHVGFLRQVKGDDGIWQNISVNEDGIFDVSYWDASAYFDSEDIVYSGYISGDINLIGNRQINIPVVPLTQAFRQFSASRLTFYNSSLTASDFMFGLRDQQDANGAYIFRPFFGDTTTNWEITTTTVEYPNLSTSTAEDLTNMTVWDVIQKLAEAENFVPMVTTDGKFKFFDRNASTASTYSFFGGQAFDPTYGNVIKKINFFGPRFTKYYSRVSVKYRDADTSTSYEIADSQYLVSGDSGPWTLGEKTLQVENTWIATSTIAETIATNLFEEYSAIRDEIDFSCTLVPHLDVFDRVEITYDQSPVVNNSLWDVYNWGDTTVAIDATDLLWDDSGGDSIQLIDEEFKLIAIDINLDSCETKFLGRK